MAITGTKEKHLSKHYIAGKQQRPIPPWDAAK